MREAVEAAMAALGYRPHRAARALRWQPHLRDRAARRQPRRVPAGRARHHSRIPRRSHRRLHPACRPAGFHLVLELLTYGDRRKAQAVAGALLDDLAPDGVVLTPPLCDLAGCSTCSSSARSLRRG
jgi:DNA-binding LacI/PurR family transcriptional regulator